MASISGPLLAATVNSDGRAQPSVQRAAARLLGCPVGPLSLVRAGTNIVLESQTDDLVFRVQSAGAECAVAENLGRIATLKDSAPFLPPVSDEIGRCGELVLTAWPRGEVFSAGDEGELARMLRKVHDTPATVDLPGFDIQKRCSERLAAARELPDWILSSLKAHLDRALRYLNSPLPGLLGERVVLHGDAHLGNAVHYGGEGYLIDLDDICIGPRCIDLLPSEVSFQRFNRDEHRRRDFWCGYGVMEGWADIEPWAVIREVTMNTWLAALAVTSQEAYAELHRRIETWDRPWKDHRAWVAI